MMRRIRRWGRRKSRQKKRNIRKKDGDEDRILRE